MENSMAMVDTAERSGVGIPPGKRYGKRYQRQYQLQMQDEDNQRVTIESNYLVKVTAWGDYLHKQWFWGRIIDVDQDYEVVKVWPKNRVLNKGE